MDKKKALQSITNCLLELPPVLPDYRTAYETERVTDWIKIAKLRVSNIFGENSDKSLCVEKYYDAFLKGNSWTIRYEARSSLISELKSYLVEIDEFWETENGSLDAKASVEGKKLRGNMKEVFCSSRAR